MTPRHCGVHPGDTGWTMLSSLRPSVLTVTGTMKHMRRSPRSSSKDATSRRSLCRLWPCSSHLCLWQFRLLALSGRLVASFTVGLVVPVSSIVGVIRGVVGPGPPVTSMLIPKAGVLPPIITNRKRSRRRIIIVMIHHDSSSSASLSDPFSSSHPPQPRRCTQETQPQPVPSGTRVRAEGFSDHARKLGF